MGDNDGLTGGVVVTVPIAMTMAAFTAIAWFNVTELSILIFVHFKNGWAASVSITLGWYLMVTGQSIVLYSPLNLIENRKKVLDAVLIMIIADFFLLHIPTTVLTFGSNSSASAKYTGPYAIMEKLQMTGFFLQETIISGIYVYNAIRIFKPAQAFRKQRIRRMMIHLAAVNFLIILMDVALLTTEYCNLYDIQTTFKAMIYSIKLKLEFAILTDLINWSHGDASFHSKAPLQPGQNLSRAARPYMFVGAGADKRVEAGLGFHSSHQSKIGYSCDARGKGFWEPKNPAPGSRVMKTTEVVVTRDLGTSETRTTDCELPIMPFEEEEASLSYALTRSTAASTRPAYAKDPSYSPRPASEIQFTKRGS